MWDWGTQEFCVLLCICHNQKNPSDLAKMGRGEILGWQHDVGRILFLSLFTTFYFYLDKKKLRCVPIDWGPMYMLKMLFCFMQLFPYWTHIPGMNMAYFSISHVQNWESTVILKYDVWSFLEVPLCPRAKSGMCLSWPDCGYRLVWLTFAFTIVSPKLPSCFACSADKALQHHKTISKPFKNLWFTSIRTWSACAVHMLCH